MVAVAGTVANEDPEKTGRPKEDPPVEVAQAW